MIKESKILLQLNNASFRYPTGDYLFTDIKLTLKEGDRTALVGINGSGKSTLLKILSGNILLDEGQQLINCRTRYVPQIHLSALKKSQKIYEYLNTLYDEWWEVLNEAEKTFNLIIDPETSLSTLSGGELMKLNLSAAIRHNPDVLILDEPTNHLDVKSLGKLISFINEGGGKKYTYLIVSHDVFFLNQIVNNTLELRDKKITSYGGNYDFYKEQKALHLKGLKKQSGIAMAKLEKAASLEQRNIEIQAKRANEAKRAFLKGSIDKNSYSMGKNAAGGVQRQNTIMLDRLKQEAEEKQEETRTEERKLSFINMKNTQENKGRTIFEVKKATLRIATAVLIKDLELKVTYGDRILIAGDNGSGKSTLIKALTGADANAILEGEVYRGDNLVWAYVDQSYSLINPRLTLLENLMEYNKEVSESKAKEQLGRVQFKSEAEMNKPANDLSGGEMVRLIIAMITSVSMDLLVMDEPTNNLDVDTIDVLVKSINNFKGALILISHNIDFLSRTEISTAYIIKNKKLSKKEIGRSNKEVFFKTITS